MEVGGTIETLVLENLPGDVLEVALLFFATVEVCGRT